MQLDIVFPHSLCEFHDHQVRFGIGNWQKKGIDVVIRKDLGAEAKEKVKKFNSAPTLKNGALNETK